MTNSRGFKAAFLCFGIFLRNDAFTQAANDIFLPRESRNYSESYSNIVAQAVKSGECYPAQLDQLGNWGGVAHGFQLSIRASTNVFIAGHPIQVAVILRNTTTNALPINDFSGRENIFFMEDGTGRVFHELFNPGGGGGINYLPAKQQIRHEYDLSSRFWLEPGMFKIRAQQTVFELPITNRANCVCDLRSAALSITIITNK